MVTQNYVLYINEKHILKSALIALKEQNSLYLFEFTIPEKHLIVGMVLRGQTVKGELLKDMPFTAIEKYLFDISNIHFTIASNEFREENKRYSFEVPQVLELLRTVLPPFQSQPTEPYIFLSEIRDVTETEITVSAGENCIVQFQPLNGTNQDTYIDLITLASSTSVRTFNYNYSGVGNYRCVSVDYQYQSLKYYFERTVPAPPIYSAVIENNYYFDDVNQFIGVTFNYAFRDFDELHLVDENNNFVCLLKNDSPNEWQIRTDSQFYARFLVPTALLSGSSSSGFYVFDPLTSQRISPQFVPII